jgi:acetolactate synthase I/II/III large subunit
LTRVADFVINALAAQGTSHVFGVGGANVEDLYDAAAGSTAVTAMLAKHEFSAGAMADGYSRATGRLGVVMATSGGAALNLVPALGESLASRVPVLALVGQAPTVADGRGSFQDTSGRNGSINAEALFAEVSLFCRRVTTASGIADALGEAIRAAKRGGPAVLLLPKDVQQSTVDGDETVREPEPAAATPPSDGLGRLAATLADHRPITIITGRQVGRDDARAALQRLREVVDAHIATTPDAKDTADGTPTDRHLGVTGVMGNPTLSSAVRDSGACLLVGTRLTMTARAGLDDALGATTTVSIGSATPFVDADHTHCDDLKSALRELISMLERTGDRDGAAVEYPRAQLRPPAHDGPGIRYRDAIAALDRLLPDGVDIVVDAGNTGAAAVHQLPSRRDGRFLVALGMGGMGYSFGAGIGVAVGRGRRTVVIAGDGSFFMHGSEIHTAIEYRLPITFVLFNNNAHAMCVTREQLFYDADYSYNRFQPSRLGAGLAAMYPGLSAVDVSTPGALPDALRTALAQGGPAVVSVECSADEIPPFAPFLTTSPPDRPEEVSSDVTARA